MKNTLFISVFCLSVSLFPGCEKTEIMRISRENIQGSWKLDSERILVSHSGSKPFDTTYFYTDYVLRINSSDTCEFYHLGHEDHPSGHLFSYSWPDTLKIYSCPVDMLCDPCSYWMIFKIIDFDEHRRMTLQQINDCNGRNEIKSTQYYTRL